ncbi:MAG: acyl-CoA synthetase (AMP-forming)/AMP-acid ligase II [Hyphomicrobiaceae bacterium]|jgi:acyl-CoA synthetase (AMP-forming)/AMP-acid ligase II
MSTAQHLSDLLRQRAVAEPDRVGFSYLADGEHESQSLTYGQLDRAAHSMAEKLLAIAKPGDRALLISAPGLEFLVGFFGCAYAGLVGVPVPAPHSTRPERSRGRLLAIATDAQPTCIIASIAEVQRLTTPGTRSALEQWPCVVADIDASTDSVQKTAPAAVDANDLAFLQYTSGSTAEPRGVMVTHRNLMHNLECIRCFGETDSTSVAVSWLPLHHDMGLIEGVLHPLYSGFPVWLMSPAAFLQKPLRWLRAISRYRATNSGAPDFAYALCARRVTDAERARLDLSSWSLAYNGSEPVRPSTLAEFSERFESCGFRSRSFSPVYGLAESTLAVTSNRRADEPSVTMLSEEAGAVATVGCGQTTGGTDLRIVDPHSCVEVSQGSPGEIWIRSESIARGYWNRPDLTAKTFGGQLSDGQGPFLRTGDFGLERDDGQLVVTGRLKDLLIVRGQKHHPTDLELTAESSHALLLPGNCAACAVGPNGDIVTILAEVDAKIVRDERVVEQLFAAIRREIALDHGVQIQRIALFLPRSLPRTTSGKLQRHLCPSLVTDTGHPALASWPDSRKQKQRHGEVAST